MLCLITAALLITGHPDSPAAGEKQRAVMLRAQPRSGDGSALIFRKLVPYETVAGHKGAGRSIDHQATAPEGGVAWRPPHGYSQHVAWDGEAVVKTFSAHTYDRRDCEISILRLLHGALPLPRLLPTGDRATIRMSYVPGILGQEWVARRGADREARHVRLMRQCGSLLRRLHLVECSGLICHLPGTAPVVVHGDFAPYNMILNPDSGELRAVIDWELAHFGSPVEDLAWMEWNMRIWYAPSPHAVEALYLAYGSLPAWPDRHQAMIDRCRPHVERARRSSFPADVAERWAEHMERTRAFHEVVPGA